MEHFNFRFVLKQLPYTLLYFLIGVITGAVFGYGLFYTKKSLYEYILSLWFKRILFGVKFLDNQYILWFILNNFVVMILIVVGSVLILMNVFRTRKFFQHRRFQSIERHHPRMTTASLYMIPIGAVFVNGFLISFFSTFVFLNLGYSKLIDLLLLLSPHGINEILALLLASSLGLSYVKIMEPLILKKRWNEAISVGKKMIFSKTTLYVLAFIAILVVFSGFIEGALTQLGLKKT